MKCTNKEVKKGERVSRKAGKKAATARGPGEGAMDQQTDGMGLAAPVRSPNPTAGAAATDTEPEAVKSAEPTGPAGTFCGLQDGATNANTPRACCLRGSKDVGSQAMVLGQTKCQQ
ncbi:hypothetical protein PAXRUDRAFT_167720 [Paxillus rubicundulus Ve08.2h10]|uniref:Uncharacterized protein n=1 Tax=Paxillus rubicundulus Ve08.2h10 TaxID=930991 RepID=A0A0D0CPA8_9AGAM|nr:hypothetical protein PAXRUDRAFT_167720 [Paxillus rubicundulus Ve08.2h10]